MKSRTTKPDRDHERPVMPSRVAWLKRKLDQATAEYHFANGYRAGIEAAHRGILTGIDPAGRSIDRGDAP
jgi:hypothetical protein